MSALTTKTIVQGVGEALDRNFTSPNEADRNAEPANVVDGLSAIARAIWKLASVIEEKQ